MKAPDHIIVGSGINALVCAAMLGGKGAKVLILERNDRIGGCMRTEEITAPGFVHDVMATTFVLFITSPAFAALGADLARHGLEFCHTGTPTGVLRPDGSHAGLGPEDAFSGQIARVIAFALEAAGAPIVKGGAKNLLAAFEALITERGGVISTDTDVASIILSDGRATGVRLASGETVHARKS